MSPQRLCHNDDRGDRRACEFSSARYDATARRFPRRFPFVLTNKRVNLNVMLSPKLLQPPVIDSFSHFSACNLPTLFTETNYGTVIQK